MSSVRVKTTYKTEGSWGSTNEHIIYAIHNNTCDVVTFYDESGDAILYVPDTLDGNILEAINRLYDYKKPNKDELVDGVGYLTQEEKEFLNNPNIPLKSRTMSVFHLKGISTKEFDKNNKEIFFETSILKFPDGNKGVLKFDSGQFSAYFADVNGFAIVDLEGVNNYKSHYLRDCEII